MLTIYATIFTQNARVPPGLLLGGGESIAESKDSGIQNLIKYKVTQDNTTGEIAIELEGMDDVTDIQMIIRPVESIIQTTLLISALQRGEGLQYMIRGYRTPDGQYREMPQWNGVIEATTLEFDNLTLLNSLGWNIFFKNAVKDFNYGLLDRDNAPFFFYREVETLARMVLELPLDVKDISDKQWETFHKTIETTPEERDLLSEIKKKHANRVRHGSRTYFSAEDHKKMLLIARIYLIKTLKHTKMIKPDRFVGV